MKLLSNTNDLRDSWLRIINFLIEDKYNLLIFSINCYTNQNYGFIIHRNIFYETKVFTLRILLTYEFILIKFQFISKILFMELSMSPFPLGNQWFWHWKNIVYDMAYLSYIYESMYVIMYIYNMHDFQYVISSNSSRLTSCKW